MADDIRCVLVEIHGIGNQKSDWSEDFDAALTAELTAAELSRLELRPVWWAQLSSLPGASSTASVAPTGSTGTTATNQAYLDYAQHLTGAEPGAAGPADFGSSIGGLLNRIIRFRDDPVTMADHVADVANYVGNNRVRLAIQERLSAALFEAQAAHPNATLILGSHSQGTIISYDVLRMLARRLPTLEVWVSMGCPLGWYLRGASWGDNLIEIPASLRWLNLYDPNDVIGQGLNRLTQWTPVQPTDVDVDNVGHGLDPHDHWHNPVVVATYAELIREVLGRGAAARRGGARRRRRTLKAEAERADATS